MLDFLRRLPYAAVFLSRGAVAAVLGNLSLAALSLALGLSLWLFVIDRENPRQVEAFSGAIPIKFVNVPNDLAVANTSETAVRIRIEGTKNDLNDVQATDFEATVNLGGFQKGEATAAVDVTSSRGRVDVVDVTPQRVDVTLESLRSKEVKVVVSPIGSPQQGFSVVNETSDPESATVTGPESLVALVDSVAAEVNLTGLRADFTDNVDLKPRDVRGGEISRVTVNPQRARVSVNLQQTDFSAEFVVNPTITGQPASGFNITGISVDPRIVTVTGPLDQLQSIDAIRGLSTEEISIADARADVVRDVRVSLPSGVQLQGSPTVRVTVSIRPAQGQATFLVVPQLRNVGAGLVVTPANTVMVTLAGDVPTLNSITPESIVVIADAQGLGPGLHVLPLQITAPPGTTLVGSDPSELGVAIAPRS